MIREGQWVFSCRALGDNVGMVRGFGWRLDMVGTVQRMAVVLSLVVMCGVTQPGFAQEAGPRVAGPRPREAAATQESNATAVGEGAKESVTTGTLNPAEGAPISYTATAGYMPLKTEQGKLRANIFYIGYVEGKGAAASQPSTQPSTEPQSQPAPLSPNDAANRPITFVFNGGPGAASVWLHMGAVGPKRVNIPDDGTAPKAPYSVVENRYSWLPATDLVFIDPVNTGYSRADAPEDAKEFFGVQADIASVGEFIRLYLTKNRRWGSPVFLAGESYGTTRAAGLADYLQERVGVSVSGVILI